MNSVEEDHTLREFAYVKMNSCGAPFLGRKQQETATRKTGGASLESRQAIFTGYPSLCHPRL